MKQKLIAIAKPLLATCMAFSWWFGNDIPSLLLLGEYSYPTEEEN